jgi:hypothetical protein
VVLGGLGESTLGLTMNQLAAASGTSKKGPEDLGYVAVLTINGELPQGFRVAESKDTPPQHQRLAFQRRFKPASIIHGSHLSSAPLMIGAHQGPGGVLLPYDMLVAFHMQCIASGTHSPEALARARDVVCALSMKTAGSAIDASIVALL